MKKAAIFTTLEWYGVEVICIQETHLTKETKLKLINKRKYQSQYHSVHSSYSRGVSIMVKTGVSFACIESRIDELGRYIFLHCLIENVPYVLANIYIPPPFKMEVLYKLTEFVVNKVNIPVYPNIPEGFLITPLWCYH